MERKVKYITFHVKKCTEAFKGRTRSPYDYRKCNKYTVPVGKVFRKYKKIISQKRRIHDMSKLINSDLLFPMNRSQYSQLLIKLTEISNTFFNSYSMMNGNHNISIFRVVSYSIQSILPIIQSMLKNEIEKICSFNIIQRVTILKFNFLICNEILKGTKDLAKDWIITDVVENLANYLSHLRTICTFIYLIIFKKKSKVINKLLPTVSYKSSKIDICGLCYQPKVACRCFAHIKFTSNRNHDLDGDDYFSPETVKNLEDENVSHFLKSVAHDEIKKSKL